MINLEEFNAGAAIPVLCERKNMSISELSEKSEVSVTAINNIISGKTVNPRVETISKICRAFGVSLADYFGIVEDNITHL